MKKKDEILKELQEQDSFLAKTILDTPFQIPQGYFVGLEEKLMTAVRTSADYQTASEELNSIAPLLKTLKKENVFEVPDQYFETITFTQNKPTSKVISITSKKWFRFAAAASVFGLVVLTRLQFFNKNYSNPSTAPHSWIEQKMKKVSTEEINSFINLAGTETNFIKDNTETTNKTMEMLMRDVSNNEIQQFFDEANFIEEIILN